MDGVVEQRSESTNLRCKLCGESDVMLRWRKGEIDSVDGDGDVFSWKSDWRVRGSGYPKKGRDYRCHGDKFLAI